MAKPLPEKITDVLTPHLGAVTADSAARHLCAKHGVIGDAAVDLPTARQLHETIRRGLVMFVGAEKAAQLADACFADMPGFSKA